MAVESACSRHLTAERQAEMQAVAPDISQFVQGEHAELPGMVLQQKRQLARLAAAQLAEQPLVPPPNSPEGQQLALEAAAALGTLRCAHLGCHNLAGASEAAAKRRKCAGCKAVRYCSEECSMADWRRHRPACRLLVAQASAATVAAVVEQG